MAVKPIGTTALTWGSLLGRGNREPIDATQLNYSYTDLLWELNQRTVSYQIGSNNGGSGNYYVGLITAVPYVNEDDKRKDSHYTVDANGNKKLETIDMKGPWYVSYKGTDKGRGTAQNKYGFVPDGNPNTYYADRIVLKQEMDYTLDNGFVRKTQLGTYYTGVGHWYDSYTKSKTYANGLECPDGVYFPTTSYAEIFNDYTHNVATGIFSHAEGGGTTASGNQSHAEGVGTTASGNYSHAEGAGTTASKDSSHAEGVGTTASGNYSHAEGAGTTASKDYSHAEGWSTKASGNYSHAEGRSTTASEDYSHAEGGGTTASGIGSHAEGAGTTASGSGSHAEGKDTTASGDYSHAEGRSTTASEQCSHVEGISTTSSGIGSHAEGNNTTAIGHASHAEGCGTTSREDYSHAEGYGTTAGGSQSHAEGGGTTASGNYSHAEGWSTTANGSGSHAEGFYTNANGLCSHVEGNNTTAESTSAHAEGERTKAIGQSSHAEGVSSYASGIGSHAEGNNTTASGNQSHTEGNTTKATGDYSHAEGGGTTASGYQSHAEGGGTKAIGQSSHAEGDFSYAGGIGSHAEGYSTKATGSNSHAEGWSTTANGSSSHAEGVDTTASGSQSHAEGGGTTASGDYSHAEGWSTTANGDRSHAEGYNTTVSAINAHAEGNFTYIHNTAENSHAEGTGSYTKGVNAHAENSSYANGKNSHSGGEATAGGVNSFAHGVKGTLASGANSIALVSGTASGSNSIAFTGTASGNSSISLDGTASGSNSVSIQGTAKSTDSVAIGQGSIAETGQGAMGLIKGHATGQQSLATNASSASGTNSVAMNASSATNTQSFAVNNSTASGINSTSTNKGTASGENSISTNISTATGVNSAALNNGNASGEGSVAMNYSKATGKGSVAIGLGTIASGEYSLSNGHETRANNHDSHAEGYGTNASGDQSHTEGIVTTTNGLASHAEGQGSTTGTNATAAHAEGSYTIANNESEHAQGKYNVSDTENSGTLFTIGNGTDNDKRHNVVGIYHNGDINIEGPNTTNHNTGYFKTTVDGSHTEVVRGNYTQTIGTTGKNNTCNITVNGNTTNRLNGTSDTRITGATYEGYGSTFISSVTGFKSSYAYNNAFNKVNKSSYNYIGESLGTYVSKSISERSDTNVYLSAPKICIHGDTATDGTYVDISSDVSYVYGRRHTYIGQHVHGGTSVTTTIKGNTINENSTTSNKTTNTNNETVTGNSTTNVTGSTNLTTGSLNITSGVTNLNLNKTHIHVTNDLCIKSSTNTYFKGATNTYVGKDQEGNKGTNFYVTSSTLGDLTSPSISLNASTKYDENIGNKSVIAKGTLTEDITGIVTTTNRNNCNIYTYGNSYTYVHGNITDTAEGERLVVTKSNVNVHNLSNSTTSTSGNTYQYTSANKTDAVGGTRTNITNGNVSTTNKANVSITTRGAHTESITNERSFTVGKHDSLIVNSGGRTEKITGEKITQVVSGNINAYTDDTHDTRLHTRSTYVETVHTYIGDKTNTYISGNYSVGLGQGIKISSYTNVSTGKYNKDEASYFAIGIGTSDTNRKNAFWISQGTTAGTNGVAYFSNNTYVYGNTYDPGQYPNNKEDKSWSAVVTYNMYRNSYTYLYKTVNDKFNTFGTGTYFTKSIDPFTYTPVSYTLHYTTQTFNNKENSWPIVKHQYVLPQAIPGALENDNSGMAGLMSARDKARLDSIWEGDKQIAGIQISTGSWQVFKNDGSTYTLANIKHQSNSITNIKVEYGFKVKWSGTWKWTVNNQKNAEECKGAWGTTLPAVNTNSSTYTSPVLSGNESGNWSQICYETIYAAKRGLIISGYPDDYAASSNGSRHLGSIVPASGKDNRSCSVSWATYRLLFYGMCTQAEADGLNIGVMKTKTTKDITKRSWEIYYNSDSSHCFFMAYPAAFGNIATIKKNGVEIITSSFLKVGAVNYTNGAGYTQQYYVYRSGVGSAGMSITIS